MVTHSTRTQMLLPNGTRIRVRWQAGWFAGTILGSSVELSSRGTVRTKTTVSYDDGTRNDHALSELEYEVISDPATTRCDPSPIYPTGALPHERGYCGSGAPNSPDEPLPFPVPSLGRQQSWLEPAAPGRGSSDFKERIGASYQVEMPQLTVAAAGPPAYPPLCHCVEPATWHDELWLCRQRVASQPVSAPPSRGRGGRGRAQRSGHRRSGREEGTSLVTGCAFCVAPLPHESAAHMGASGDVTTLVTTHQSATGYAQGIAAILTAAAYSLEDARDIGGWHDDYVEEMPTTAFGKGGKPCRGRARRLGSAHWAVMSSSQAAGRE